MAATTQVDVVVACDAMKEPRPGTCRLYLSDNSVRVGSRLAIRYRQQWHLCRSIAVLNDKEEEKMNNALAWDPSVKILADSTPDFHQLLQYNRLWKLTATTTSDSQNKLHQSTLTNSSSSTSIDIDTDKLLEDGETDIVLQLQHEWSPLNSIVFQTSTTTTPIVRAALKRCLIGQDVFIGSTEIQLHIRKHFSFRTQPPPPQTDTIRKAFHSITADTKITFQECHPNTIEKLLPPSSHLSPVAQRLVEAITATKNNSHVTTSFLLTGPPGVGKTFAVRQAIAHTQTSFQLWNGSDVLAQHPTPAQAATYMLQQQFQRGLLFLDECDALVADELLSAALSHCLDGMDCHVVVVAATNRADVIPAPLRRRFHEIPFAPPNATTRQTVLESLLTERNRMEQITIPELKQIADLAVGFVPADLAALVRHACTVNDTCTANHTTMSLAERLEQSLPSVGASALRDVQVPHETSWDDIVGNAGGAKRKLQQAMEWPRLHQQAYQQLGIAPPKGILLYGPPGCAKTSLARAAAAASGVAFVSLAPADVYASSYVGQAELVVRNAFSKARSAAPCVLFFDEIDAILGSASASRLGMARGSSSEARVLSTFLNEMDGVDGSWLDGVLVLGATNRPWTLDAAILRPGRFDKVLYVPPPSRADRRLLLERQCKDWNATIDFELLSSISENMSGAEIVGACRHVAMQMMRASVDGCDSVPCESHLMEALKSVQPVLTTGSMQQDFLNFAQTA